MLPKRKRLVKKRDFDAVYQKGSTYYSENRRIALKCLKNKLKSVRIGFIVGKKYSLKAVARNKAKRQLRAAFFKKINLIKVNMDIVVLLKKSDQNKKKREYADMEQQIKGIINKIK